MNFYDVKLYLMAPFRRCLKGYSPTKTPSPYSVMWFSVYTIFLSSFRATTFSISTMCTFRSTSIFFSHWFHSSNWLCRVHPTSELARYKFHIVLVRATNVEFLSVWIARLLPAICSYVRRGIAFPNCSLCAAPAVVFTLHHFHSSFYNIFLGNAIWWPFFGIL